jgi:uncharacterized protein
VERGDGDEFNLWPTEVVPEDDLVGRGAAISRIERDLLAGRSVLLAAPRREGKSSVARDVLRRLEEDERYLTASLDFFRLTTKRQCADDLVRQLLERSKKFGSRLKRLKNATTGRLPSFEPHFKLAEVELGFRLSPRDVDEDEAFRNALQLPEKLAEQGDRRVVVLMDEFQDAGKNLGQDVYRVMRSYFQEQPRTKQLFAGSNESLLRALFGKGNAALLRYATEVPLAAIGRSDWIDYIVRKFESIEVVCSPVLAGQLVDATGGHPADTMAACAQLTTVLREGATSEVTADVLAVGLAHTQVTLRLIFDEIWSELGSVANARLVVQRLAFDQPVSTGLKGAQAGRALTVLTDKGLVVRSGRKWAFREPLFREYVKDMAIRPLQMIGRVRN